MCVRVWCREGHSKLFMLPLPPKKRAANQAQSTPILSVLHRHAGAAKEVSRRDESAGCVSMTHPGPSVPSCWLSTPRPSVAMWLL